MIFIGSLPLYFNSRPSARGDPVNVERKSFTPSHFNSRPSARGDVRVLVAAIIGAISIHAPPRGATLVFCSSFAFCPFQFTPLREGRLVHGHVVPSGAQFQFTPLREGRLSSFLSSVPHQLFQFTPLREGRPSIPRGTVTTTPSFQFTPLREGRHGSRRTCENEPIHFNSRPSARGDCKNIRFTSPKCYFNSRPSARGDAGHGDVHQCGSHFNSRPSARGDC